MLTCMYPEKRVAQCSMQQGKRNFRSDRHPLLIGKKLRGSRSSDGLLTRTSFAKDLDIAEALIKTTFSVNNCRHSPVPRFLQLNKP